MVRWTTPSGHPHTSLLFGSSVKSVQCLRWCSAAFARTPPRAPSAPPFFSLQAVPHDSWDGCSSPPGAAAPWRRRAGEWHRMSPAAVRHSVRKAVVPPHTAVRQPDRGVRVTVLGPTRGPRGTGQAWGGPPLPSASPWRGSALGERPPSLPLRRCGPTRCCFFFEVVRPDCGVGSGGSGSGPSVAFSGKGKKEEANEAPDSETLFESQSQELPYGWERNIGLLDGTPSEADGTSDVPVWPSSAAFLCPSYAPLRGLKRQERRRRRTRKTTTTALGHPHLLRLFLYRYALRTCGPHRSPPWFAVPHPPTWREGTAGPGKTHAMAWGACYTRERSPSTPLWRRRRTATRRKGKRCGTPQEKANGPVGRRGRRGGTCQVEPNSNAANFFLFFGCWWWSAAAECVPASASARLPLLSWWSSLSVAWRGVSACVTTAENPPPRPFVCTRCWRRKRHGGARGRHRQVTFFGAPSPVDTKIA